LLQPKVIEYIQNAKARGFSIVANEIGVSRQLVHHGCKLIKEGSLVSHPSNSNRCNRPGQGRKTSITPEVENTLITTFTDLCEAKLRVTTKLLAGKVIHTFPSFHIVTLQVSEGESDWKPSYHTPSATLVTIVAFVQPEDLEIGTWTLVS
jgi:hypothetical protein